MTEDWEKMSAACDKCAAKFATTAELCVHFMTSHADEIKLCQPDPVCNTFSQLKPTLHTPSQPDSVCARDRNDETSPEEIPLKEQVGRPSLSKCKATKLPISEEDGHHSRLSVFSTENVEVDNSASQAHAHVSHAPTHVSSVASDRNIVAMDTDQNHFSSLGESVGNNGDEHMDENGVKFDSEMVSCEGASVTVAMESEHEQRETTVWVVADKPIPSLSRSSRRNRGGKIPYSCKDCGARFHTLTSLDEHLKCAHGEFSAAVQVSEPTVITAEIAADTGVFFMCVFCKALFQSEENLSDHAKVCVQHTTGAGEQLVQGRLSPDAERPYKCDQCKKSFSFRSGLLLHRRVHAEKPFKCQHCSTRFSSGKMYREHTQRQNKAAGKFTCRICSLSFAHQCARTQHVKKSHNMKWHTCSHCDTVFKTRYLLTEHLQSHIGEKTNGCKECGEVFARRSHLYYHTRTQHGGKSMEKSLPCSRCSETFTSLKSLRKHAEKAHMDMRYKCDECTSSFYSKNYLATHKKVHAGGNPYACKGCSETFTFHHLLTAHVKEKHVGELLYCCVRCGSSFPNRSKLTMHMRTHTGERPYDCALCGKSFNNQSNLGRHVLIHSEPRPFTCDQCDWAFALKEELVDHKARKHGTDAESANIPEDCDWLPRKPSGFACDVCGKTFVQKIQLIVHSRTHTGEKPFVCDRCGQKFAHSGTLTSHMLTHSGERPYMCDVCGKSFRQVSHLKHHMLTHTGEKPFKCDICELTFTQKGNMKQHQLIHTGEKRSRGPGRFITGGGAAPLPGGTSSMTVTIDTEPIPAEDQGVVQSGEPLNMSDFVIIHLDDIE